MSECPVCERPVHGTVLDQFCLDEIIKCLNQVPDLLAELEVNATRQAKTTPRASGGRSAETPMPYDMIATDAIRELTQTLVTWATAVAPYSWHAPLRYLPPPTDARTAARWLIGHANLIRQHAAAEKIYDRITKARAHALVVIDRRPDLVPVGQCGADLDDGEICPEILYVDPDLATVRCRCGAQHDADRTWMLEAARDQEWTAAEIGRAIPGVTAAMIRRYAQRGRIMAVGDRKLGPNRATPTYRVGDLLEVLSPFRETA